MMMIIRWKASRNDINAQIRSYSTTQSYLHIHTGPRLYAYIYSGHKYTLYKSYKHGVTQTHASHL